MFSEFQQKNVPATCGNLRGRSLKKEVDCRSATFALLQKILKFFAQSKAAFSWGTRVQSGMWETLHQPWPCEWLWGSWPPLVKEFVRDITYNQGSKCAKESGVQVALSSSTLISPMELCSSLQSLSPGNSGTLFPIIAGLFQFWLSEFAFSPARGIDQHLGDQQRCLYKHVCPGDDPETCCFWSLWLPPQPLQHLWQYHRHHQVTGALGMNWNTYRRVLQSLHIFMCLFEKDLAAILGGAELMHKAKDWETTLSFPNIWWPYASCTAFLPLSSLLCRMKAIAIALSVHNKY